jgi:hypothetical protein
MGKSEFQVISSLFEGYLPNLGLFIALKLFRVKTAKAECRHPSRFLTGDISNQFSFRQLSYLIIIIPG